MCRHIYGYVFPVPTQNWVWAAVGFYHAPYPLHLGTDAYVVGRTRHERGMRTEVF